MNHLYCGYTGGGSMRSVFYNRRLFSRRRYVAYNSMNFSYESAAEAIAARNPGMSKKDIIKKLKRLSKKELRALARTGGLYDLDMAHREWKKYAADGSNPELPVVSQLRYYSPSSMAHFKDDNQVFATEDGDPRELTKEFSELNNMVYPHARPGDTEVINDLKNKIGLSLSGEYLIKKLLAKKRKWADNADVEYLDSPDDMVKVGEKSIPKGLTVLDDLRLKMAGQPEHVRGIIEHMSPEGQRAIWEGATKGTPAAYAPMSNTVYLVKGTTPASGIHELGHARSVTKSGQRPDPNKTYSPEDFKPDVKAQAEEEARANRMLLSMSSRVKNGHDAMAMRNMATLSNNSYLKLYPGTYDQFKKHDRKAGAYGVRHLDPDRPTPEFSESEKKYNEALETE